MKNIEIRRVVGGAIISILAISLFAFIIYLMSHTNQQLNASPGPVELKIISSITVGIISGLGMGVSLLLGISGGDLIKNYRDQVMKKN